MTNNDWARSLALQQMLKFTVKMMWWWHRNGQTHQQKNTGESIETEHVYMGL